MKRLALFLTVALLPVILIGYLYPDRVLKGPSLTEVFHSTPGSDIVVFVRDGCPHCAAFEKYALEREWNIEYHEVTQIDSQKIFLQLQERAPLLNQGVPTIIINGSITQGYEDDQTGEFFKKKLDTCQSSPDGCQVSSFF